MKYRQLTEGTRYQIALLPGEKISLTEISKRVGVSKSTVSREVRRNGMGGDYSAAEAQRLSEARRRSAAKHSVSPDTVFYVETGLCWKWSPEQISAICKRIGSPVSHEWIYQHVQADKASGGELYRHLRQGKRRYRKGYGTKRGRIPDAVSIEHRPAVVDERSRLGDREADLVLGAQGTGAIVTLAERKSRICLTKKVFPKDAGEVSSAIISMLSGYKDACHTITFDNGGEFSKHRAIAEALEVETYFAHPYASHERGLNENTNGLLRQFIPKGTDLRTVSEEDLQHYQGGVEQQATQVSRVQATIGGVCRAKNGGLALHFGVESANCRPYLRGKVNFDSDVSATLRYRPYFKRNSNNIGTKNLSQKEFWTVSNRQSRWCRNLD